MTGGAEKRQYERVSVSFSLVVKDGERRVGTIEDISAGGMRIRLDPDTDLGENVDVREWTGHAGTDNREYVLTQLVGEEFSLTIIYMSVTLGVLKARLVRVIRHLTTLFFAMQFTEADPKTVERIMGLVKKRAGQP